MGSEELTEETQLDGTVWLFRGRLSQRNQKSEKITFFFAWEEADDASGQSLCPLHSRGRKVWYMRSRTTSTPRTEVWVLL